MARPVKWVLHKSGGNPVIWLIYDDTVSSWQTATIASDLQKSYKARGINPDAVVQKTINRFGPQFYSQIDNNSHFEKQMALQAGSCF